MRFWLAALAVLAVPLLISAQEKKKGPELVLVEFHARRNVDVVQLDGRVKNIGGKTAEGVTLIFHFLAPGGATMTTQKGPLDTDDLGPNEEATFLLETQFPARSVRIRVEAVNRGEMEVKLQKGGPYAIE